MRQSYIDWVTNQFGKAAGKRYAKILGNSSGYRRSLDMLLAELARERRAQITREIKAKAVL